MQSVVHTENERQRNEKERSRCAGSAQGKRLRAGAKHTTGRNSGEAGYVRFPVCNSGTMAALNDHIPGE